MPFDNSKATATAVGNQQVEAILARRKVALAHRSEAIAAHPRKMQMVMRTSGQGAAAVDTTTHTTGYLVAAGDSWFAYPFFDVLKKLHDEHGYNVDATAHAGEAIEHMAYHGGQLEEVQRCLEREASHGIVPLAVLLSGGGDDIAGKEFGMLLNNATSGTPGWNEEMLTGLVDERLNAAYKVMLTAINGLCLATMKREVPIIFHGYDYPVPDGRGYWGGWGFLPGPWLKPGFDEKLFGVVADNVGWMRKIIDRFNAMLSTLPAEYPNAHYLDLRNTLAGAEYKKLWGNELHPTEHGFSLVAAKFSRMIDVLHP